MKPGRGRQPEALLAAAFALLLMALAADVWLQRRAVPPGLRYVPIDCQVWVATGPLRALWEGARPHLAAYFAARNEDTPMNKLASTLRQRLEIPRDGPDDLLASMLRQRLEAHLDGPDDLRNVGIDPDAGVVVAHRRGMYSGTLIVLPVSNRALLIAALERWFEDEFEPAPPEAGRDAVAIGDMLLGFGDDGSAVLADRPELLRESLERQDAQLAHHRSIDRDARRFARLHAAGGSAAWLQGRVQSLPLVEDVHFVLDPEPKTLRLRARTLLAPGRSAALERALAPPPPPGPYGHATLQRSDLAATVADEALADIVRLLATDALARRISGVEERFPGLLPQLVRARSLRRISVATLDTRERVPGMVLGLELAQDDADALVLGVQRALRVKRDREILRAAQASEPMPDDARAVLAAVPLATAADPLWSRYQGAAAEAEPQPELKAEDFAGADHVVTGRDGQPLRYLMPPFTDDDLRWRLADDEERAKLRVDDLQAGRFRVCSAWRDGTLWVATDAAALERWLSLLRVPPTGTDFADAAAGLGGAASAKLIGLALPQALRAAAALHPDAEVRRQRLDWLADLDGYRSLLLSVRPAEERGLWDVDVQLVRP